MRVPEATFGVVLLFAVPSALAQPPKPASSAQTDASRLAPLDAAKIESARADTGAGEPSPELLVKIEVLLDRASFSPGEIDGKDGENLKRALATYKEAHGSPIHSRSMARHCRR